MDATHTEQWRKWNIENAMRAMTVFIHVQRSCNVYHRFWIGETERNKTIIMQKKTRLDYTHRQGVGYAKGDSHQGCGIKFTDRKNIHKKNEHPTNQTKTGSKKKLSSLRI